jgi:hypothetical protein
MQVGDVMDAPANKACWAGPAQPAYIFIESLIDIICAIIIYYYYYYSVSDC